MSILGTRIRRGTLATTSSGPIVPAGVKLPTTLVDGTTSFADETLYVVRLAEPADYQGVALLPMNLHTVKGKVATAIRTAIAAYDLA